MKEIRIITPIAPLEIGRDPKDFDYLKGRGVELSHTHLDQGPAFIDSEATHLEALPFCLEKIQQACEAGVGGVITDCMADVAMKEAREQGVNIPVIGPSYATFKMAALIDGQRFGILSLNAELVTLFKTLWLDYGYSVSDFYAHDMKLHDLSLLLNHDALFDELLIQAENFIKTQSVDKLVFGCTAFTSMAKPLQAALRQKGYQVTVLDPMLCAFYLTLFLLDNDPHEKSQA